MTSTQSLTAHPVAALFPMLADDELAELAADIKQRGLLHPIVLDTDGRVLDGRNRLAACEQAGVEPTFETYDGPDPDGYALAVNVTRRNLLPKQRYLVIEKARRLSGVAKSLRSTAREAGTDPMRLAEAAVVWDYAPDLAEEILAGGGPSLGDAATEARERKKKAQETETRKKHLRKAASDLAALVDEGRISLDDATSTLDARQAKAQREAEEKASEKARRAHEASVERARDVEAARTAARSIVADLQSRVVAIIIGLRHGEPRLIDKVMVRQLHDAIDQLEELL